MIRHINASNVNEAFAVVMNTWFKDARSYREISPRGRTTLEIRDTVATCYLRPTERVLACTTRDANPFLHLFDALWVLGGRNDVAFMAGLRSTMAEYSDDGRTFHGAYGLRMAMNSQLARAIEELRRDPDSRRAVIALWQPGLDAGYTGKDVPCNTTIALKIRDGALNITVFNRSNDAVWGAYGANVVQFSMLQEYIAMLLGVGVGVYVQVSDSLHIYPDVLVVQRLLERGASYMDPYANDPQYFRAVPLNYECTDVNDWTSDLYEFFRAYDNGSTMSAVKTEWWAWVADPMWRSYRLYRDGRISEAIAALDMMYECDWKCVALEWLHRRAKA